MEDLSRYEPYTLHGFDLSYFTGKMQCYLAYKEVPHRRNEIAWRELGGRLAPKTGLVEVPMVERADGVVLRDTTAMIGWFEERYPAGAVLPEDPASAYLCRLLEDYADEGLWRPALYYRWAFDKDAILNARRFTEDFLAFPLTPALALRWNVRRRQRRFYLAGEGITARNRQDVERHYHDELRDLETVFRLRPFLFGDRPSLADFGYFASMFRHFGIDPTPARIMRDEAPAVYEWVARMWNARASRIGDAPWAPTRDGLPEGLEPLLERAARRYLPVLHSNALAVAQRQVFHDAVLEDQVYPRLAPVPFLAWRRTMLQQDLAQLPSSSADTVREVLRRTGCLAWLERDGVLAARYPQGAELPFSRPRRLGLVDRLKMQLFGTPHHREAGTVAEAPEAADSRKRP
jgi:glutathione S-transferase